jgi:catechol 2,3-dioxygenase-like lactoylglutathione lyase family enzyme
MDSRVTGSQTQRLRIGSVSANSSAGPRSREHAERIRLLGESLGVQSVQRCGRHGRGVGLHPEGGTVSRVRVLLADDHRIVAEGLKSLCCASARTTAPVVNVFRALLAAGALALLVTASGHARDRLSGDVQRIKMIGFTVADVDREADFFTKVLQFEKVADFRVVGNEYDKMEGVFNANMRIVHLRLGDQIVELTQYVSPPTGRPIPVPSYSNDAWFEHMAIVVSDMDAAYKILQENNVRQISAYAITIPPTNPGAAGIKAIKFQDPEGHDLELLYYPPGKGEPSFHKPTNKLFLGLSHTAMTVASTEKGVVFYRDLLGFEVGGFTFNTGATQEVLDNLFNDTCRVTEMMPISAPPHIEFLGYQTPPGGRPMPADTRANDLWHWQTSLVTKDIQAVTDRLREAGVQFITPDVVSIPREAQAQLGFKKAVMVRDPNGHAIRLIEE